MDDKLGSSVNTNDISQIFMLRVYMTRAYIQLRLNLLRNCTNKTQNSPASINA